MYYMEIQLINYKFTNRGYARDVTSCGTPRVTRNWVAK